MCGIVGYIGYQDATDILIDGLKKLEYRGYDSAGIAVIDHGEIKVVKTKGRIKDIEDKLAREGAPHGVCGIGHTRWATHGEPSDVNSHPHGNSRVSIIHNGIIENYMQIKEFLVSKGYEFISETDTETVAKLLDYYYGEQHNPLDAIISVVGHIRGSYALGIVFRDYPNTVYAVRKNSPLIVGLGEGENFIASDIPAILKYTRKYYLLDEDEIAVLQKDSVHIYDEQKMPIHKEIYTANFDIEAAEKGGYPHFMLKEIYEQPKVVKDTITPHLDENGLPSFSWTGFDESFLKGLNKMFVVACGTAMNCGMAGKYLFEELCRLPVEVDIASEFRYRNPVLTRDDLVLIISQSGETADSLAALRLAKERGAKTVAIVNVVGSSIAREADCVIYTMAGPEIAVASTKAYCVQLVMLYMLAVRIALIRGEMDEAQGRKVIDTLLSIPDLIAGLLERSEDIKYIASLYQYVDDLFFIGRGLDYALAQEASLKLKEISYIHSEAYAAGELKHGTISLIVDGTPVMSFATQDRLFEKMVGNIKEVKARGASVVLFCKAGCETFGIADHVIELPALDDLYMPLVLVAPFQLLAYYMAVLRGSDVDKPRNLAKSVTVE